MYMTIDESTSSVNSMTTANTFLKAKLILFRCYETLKSVKKAVLKHFRNYWTDGDSSKVIACQCLSTNVVPLGNWYNVTSLKTY